MSESEKIAGNNTQVSRNIEPVSAHAVSIHLPTFWPDKISLWFKQLNARTVPDRYLVPHIEDFARTLHRCEVFTTIDLVRAYNQIPVASEDVEKTAITTPLDYLNFHECILVYDFIIYTDHKPLTFAFQQDLNK